MTTNNMSVAFASLIADYDMEQLARSLWVAGVENWCISDNPILAKKRCFYAALRRLIGTDNVRLGVYRWAAGQFCAGWDTAERAQLERTGDDTREFD